MLRIIFILCGLQMRASLGAYVIDHWTYDESGIRYGDYCPEMRYCPAGSHVMCMYFNPNTSVTAGPECTGFQNISISSELADKILFIVNEIRGKIAQGHEIGMDNTNLPRAYGLFRLEWDSELATFAQILANTCHFRNDYCRATAQFPEPGQLVYGNRYDVHDWRPIDDKKVVFKDNDLSEERLEYTAMKGFKRWYESRKRVSLDMIGPYSSKNVSDPKYLQLVDGGATHMGCGISSYTDYKYSENKKPVYHFIHLVCNFSSRPQKGKAVFDLENEFSDPNGQHYSKCGCPEGSVEDENCLCSFNKRSDCLDGECKPSVVLLPIFTVDDQVQNAQNSLKRLGQEVLARQEDPEWDIEEGLRRLPKQNTRRRNNMERKMPRQARTQQRYKSPSQFESSLPSSLLSRSQYDRDSLTDYPQFSGSIPSYLPLVETGSDDDAQRFQANYEQKNLAQLRNIPSPIHTRRKASIFAAAPKFSLHDLSSTMSQQPKPNNALKMNFMPKPNPSKAKQLVNTYHNQQSRIDSTKTPVLSFNDVLKQTLLGPSSNKALLKLIDKGKEQLTQDITANEELDNKLITLLDTLEQEVNRIQLGANEKEIFDARIRRIYGTAVGKTPVFTSNHIEQVEPQGEIDFEDIYLENIEDPNKRAINKEMYDTEDKVNELNSNRHAKSKTLHRTKVKKHNFIVPDEDSYQDPEDFDNTLLSVKNRSPSERTINDFEIEDHFKKSKPLLSKPNRLMKPEGKTRHKKRVTSPINPYTAFLENRPLKSGPGKRYRNRFSEDKYELHQNDNVERYSNNEYKNSYDGLKKEYASYEGTEVDGRANNDYPEKEKGQMSPDYDYGNDDEPLALERRKYYQEKLDKIKEKRNQQQKTVEDVRRRRLMRDDTYDNRLRPFESDPSQFYLPDRVRALHSRFS